MNTSSSSRPRFICRWVRTVNACVTGVGTRHLAACDDCQAALRATAELERELRSAAAVLRQSAPEPSAGLERSILRAVRENQVFTPPARSWSPSWAIGGAALAARAMAVMVVQRVSTASSFAGATPSDAIAVVDAVQDFSVEMTQTVIPTAGAAVANNPLQQELGSVYSDARAALDFLALNFLPPTRTAALPQTETTI